MWGSVTVSTQMAGRGTDIRLGGADERDRDAVVAAGGLAVIGTGRHRTARLDNQLRGRSGRQGDPGLSVFFRLTGGRYGGRRGIGGVGDGSTRC